jgi:signal transduction histidine kinase
VPVQCVDSALGVYCAVKSRSPLRLGVSTVQSKPDSAERMSAQSIDAKLARLQELEQRFDDAVERAKLEAMKELAYGAGHEINNPLANIATRAQTLLHEETDPEKRRKLAAINAQAFRAHEMIADIALATTVPCPDRSTQPAVSSPAVQAERCATGRS